ncbi:MAG: glycoside hydrolase family 9 protein, partial [Candidatus Hydrogenedentes bacterium]|nr:glycoside hydrolase family 9 protein [Candidatus Hydrogenedentota bacterium]
MYTSSKGLLCPRAAVLAAIAGVLAWHASAAEPELLWSYEAQSNLYPSPLVADVHPSPGLESIISDSEVREMLCVDANGELLWRYNGGWTRRLTSGASLSSTARDGAGTLLIGNSDGKLCCVDAATGQELWTRSVGSIEWGTAIWADLDGDGVDEAIAGTQNAIVALTAAGDPLWTRDAFEDKPVNINGPIAAADLDGDGRVEIVALDQSGPFCVSFDGQVRWRRITGDQFQGAPVVTRLVSDGPATILALSGDSDFVYCFDALNGEPLWKCGILGSPDAYAAGGLAAGDIDGDGSTEIIAPDNSGHVHCVDHTGTLRWVFTTDKATHSAASIGDVDGDGEIEILVASGDHNLYCVNTHGRLEWKYRTGLRLIRPATIADIDGDGRTDILFGGSDRRLRCLTLGGRYDPALIPWPSNRANVAQTGSTLNRKTDTPRLVSTTRELVDNGDFRRAESRQDDGDDEGGPPAVVRVPISWREESLESNLRWTESGGRDDSPCATVLPSAANTVFATKPIPIDTGMARVDVEVFAAGDNCEAVSAYLRWMGDRGELRVDALQSAAESEGWRALAGAGIQPPENAEWVQLVCTTPASDTEIRWDDATIMAHYDERPLIKPAVNQVGYDIGAPKRFTAWSNFVGESPATFALVNESGTVAFEGELTHEGRITGAYGNDWGNEYWRGDFSAFDEPGTYRVRVTIDEASGESWPFAISEDRIWAKTAEPAYQFFYYQRCGMEVPGFHGACHLDDAVSPDGERQYSLSGGWHDAGDYNTYNNAPYVYGLLRAYEARTDAFNAIDRDGNGQSDFLDEISWGADLMRRMIAPDGSSRGDISSGYGFWGPPELETDNIPNTGDERRIRGAESGNDPANHLAAAAKIARFVEPNDAYVEAAKQAFAWRAERGSRDARQLSAALDLYTLTGEAAYADAARALLPEVGYGDAAIVERYDEIFNEDHSAQVRDAYVARADAILALANNPFGVYMYGAPDNPTFFGTPPETGGWHVGNSSHVLEAANTAAIAYRYTGDTRYLAFVYDQLNWILGNNPYDLCLMEGVGSRHPPTYHHRYAMAGVPRGAVPGSVVNGITWRAPGDDRPHFDMRGLDIPD